MASDIAEMLKQNFLEFLKDQDHLNLSHNITSLLTGIQKEFIENEGFWSPPPIESLSYFYQLDHVLAECRTNKKTFPVFSRLNQVERTNEKALIEIKKKFLDMRKSEVNENLTLTLDTSCMFPTRKDIPNSSVFNEEIENIVNWLESNDGFKAIGIHGMCGTGKSTLAKMVLHEERVQKKYNKQIWVCLYDLKSIDEMDIKIVKEMLAQLDDDPDLLTEEPQDSWLVEKLNGKLKAQKKYLIVLDAVWHCNEWFNDLYVDENVNAVDKTTKQLLFSQALPKDVGGAVIVTSRQQEVTNKLVGGKNLINLKPLDDEKRKELVRQCLERKGKSPVPEEIDCIAYHCHGHPFVAVTLSDWIAQQITNKSLLVVL